jgi:hypothetical protein
MLAPPGLRSTFAVCWVAWYVRDFATSTYAYHDARALRVLSKHYRGRVDFQIEWQERECKEYLCVVQDYAHC